MTGPQQDLPELGPYLGRMADATRRFEIMDVALDRVRLGIVSQLFERAGAAREFLLTGDRESARSSLDRAAWTELWRTAVAGAAEATLTAIGARLTKAASTSGYSTRRLAGALPNAEDRAVLTVKLEAAGIPLEQRLAAGFPKDAAWPDAVRLATVALDDSWEALEDVVRGEIDGQMAAVTRIGTWKPSRRPMLVVATLAGLAAVWLGLVLGGYLPRPGWLDGFSNWFWSLPWP